MRWVRELVGASSGWLQSEEATLGAFPPIPISRRTRRRHSGAAIRSCSAVGVAWRQNSVGTVQRVGRTELVSLDAREGVAGNGARKDRRSERRPWGRNADLLSVERASSACDRSYGARVRTRATLPELVNVVCMICPIFRRDALGTRPSQDFSDRAGSWCCGLRPAVLCSRVQNPNNIFGGGREAQGCSTAGGRGVFSVRLVATPEQPAGPLLSTCTPR